MAGRRGRPPLSATQRSTRVCFALTESQYDAIFTFAKTQRATVPEIVRRALRRLLDERGGAFSNNKSTES